VNHSVEEKCKEMGSRSGWFHGEAFLGRNRALISFVIVSCFFVFEAEGTFNFYMDAEETKRILGEYANH
jgi:hypothetical protein